MMKYKLIANMKMISVILLTISQTTVFAQQQPVQKEFGFDKDVTYDIYYEVSSFETDVLERVKVNGLVSIDGRSFLVFSSLDFIGKIEMGKGYILFDAVRAVLPNGSRKPKRVFDISSFDRYEVSD